MTVTRDQPGAPPVDDPAAGTERELAVLRRRVAELEAERDEALGLAASRARWLAHVSHELRTPMNGILGMTRLALDTELSEEQRQHLDLVRRSADSLLTLINDTLDHAKITSGRLALEHIPFNLRDALDIALKTMAITAAERGLELKVEELGDLPARVAGDPGRLRQVIFNLVGNAIKFTETGSVTVRLHATATDEGRATVRFDVADTGIGIAPERLATIFEPFEQAEASTSRRFGGTGLGLTISRQLVELMGGELAVDSAEGQGTTFWFTLELPVVSEPARPELAVHLADLRVLMISDNPVNRNTLLEVLEAEHLAAMVVEEPTEALAYLTKAAEAGRSFDVILFDLQRAGLRVAEMLLRHPAAVASRALFLTPSGQRGDAARCRALGIAAYLTGLMTSEDLTAALRAVLEGSADLVTRHWLREHRRSLRILLADDSSTNRLIATRMLERQGHEVVAVQDGRAAVEAFRDGGRFDAVLMDLEMPEMDGLAAARHIREAEDGHRTPMLALTGHVSEADGERVRAAGMDGLIPKPFQPDEVAAALRGVVTR